MQYLNESSLALLLLTRIEGVSTAQAAEMIQRAKRWPKNHPKTVVYLRAARDIIAVENADGGDGGE